MTLADVPQAPVDGEFFCPPVLFDSGKDAYLLQGLAYDAAGKHTPEGVHGVLGGSLDLREGAKLVITSGMYAERWAKWTASIGKETPDADSWCD